MELKLTGPKHLTLQSSQVAYILDCLSERPYKDVVGLIENLFVQLKQQENSDEIPQIKDNVDGNADGSGRSGPAA